MLKATVVEYGARNIALEMPVSDTIASLESRSRAKLSWAEMRRRLRQGLIDRARGEQRVASTRFAAEHRSKIVTSLT